MDKVELIVLEDVGLGRIQDRRLDRQEVRDRHMEILLVLVVVISLDRDLASLAAEHVHGNRRTDVRSPSITPDRS
jgi:hypothetical protein